MIKINLLDRKAVQGPLSGFMDAIGASDVSPEEWQRYRSGIAKVALLFVVIYLIDYIPAEIKRQKIAELEAQATKLEEQHTKLTSELKTKQAVRSEMEKINAAENEIKGKLAVITSLDSDRYRAFKVMDTVSLMIPDRVWVERLNFTAKTVDLTGASWEFLPINDFVGLLRQSGIFDNVRLKQIVTAPSPRGIVPGVPVALQTLKRYDVSADIRATAVTPEAATSTASTTPATTAN